MDSKQTYCVGGRHESNTVDKIEYEKRNPETNKIVKVRTGKCDICNGGKSQIFAKYMTREDFMKKGKCKNKHCSAMSNSASCDLNSKGDTLKLHDTCHNPKLKCQKQITLTPRQFQLEGAGFKKKLQNFFKGTQTAWKKFLKPAVNVAAPSIGKAVGARTKNPQIAQATTNILKHESGGKILSLTGMHGHGLCLKVM